MTEPLFNIVELSSYSKPADFFDHFDEDYYPRIAYIRRERGDCVNWYIRRGSMRVDSDYIIPTSGNIWNFSKLLAMKNYLEDGNRINLPSILGTIEKVSLTEIAEMYEQSDRDLLYDGYTRKMTTSIEELDEYINADYRKDTRTMKTIEEEYPEFKSYLKLMKRGRKPKGVDLGDFGKTYAHIGNDFNHRIFAAIMAGESYIWIYVEPMNRRSK